jgi:hypothetical protein
VLGKFHHFGRKLQRRYLIKIFFLRADLLRKAQRDAAKSLCHRLDEKLSLGMNPPEYSSVHPSEREKIAHFRQSGPVGGIARSYNVSAQVRARPPAPPNTKHRPAKPSSSMAERVCGTNVPPLALKSMRRPSPAFWIGIAFGAGLSLVVGVGLAWLK